MLTLDQLEPGMRVQGLSADGPAIVIAVTPYGATAARVVFEVEHSGRPESRVLMRSHEERLALAPVDQGRAFDADGRLFRLLMEAERLRLAHLFDPRLAVSTSRVEALPHQIAAVYETMLPRQPLRFLLADDPGAGKTIMTGLLIKELLLRADIERCLVVVPAALDVQWQDELRDKFGLRFALAGREQIQGALGNVFEEQNLVIGRIDLLKQDEQIDRLTRVQWDLVVVDEAHKMSATYLPGPNEIKPTARYRLGQALGERTRHFLLLTATPHRGKQADFELLLALLDPDRFAGGPGAARPVAESRDLMRRMLKEDLVDFEGRPLFPDRRATTVSYTLSDPERDLYDAVTRYVRQEMTRADQMATHGGEGKRRRAVVGFALTVLQRRIASSPEAILRSLQRRRARLAATAEALRGQRAAALANPNHAGDFEPIPATQLRFDLDLGVAVKGSRLDVDELETDLDERPEGEADAIVDRASAAQSLADLEREVDLLGELEAQAVRLRERGLDAKWQRLRALLADPAMFDAQGRRQKLVVFTEHRDTLEYLVARLRTELGRDEDVAFIHGGLSRDERRREQSKFLGDDPDVPEASILVATDAAGEGINLQVAHLLVNYDLPWNPNRLEQRFGRIHRFGQTRACFNWNLVASNTREGDVYRTLFDKLEEARAALGGKVFDVLGQIFLDRPLRDLLLDAIREDDPCKAAQIDRELAALASLERYREIVDRQSLIRDDLEPDRIKALRAERDRAAANRLAPHFIGNFFVEALRELGGVVEERVPGEHVLLGLPHELRRRGRGAGLGNLDRRRRLRFDGAAGPAPTQRDERDRLRRSGDDSTGAMLVTPGAPLFDLTLDLLRERHGALLQQGAALVDPRTGADQPRVLVAVQSEIVDERSDGAGQRRAASADLRFIEVEPDGTARDAGPAPHLDYRPLADAERELVLPLLAEAWVRDAPTAAESFVVEQLLPAHLTRVKHEREDHVLRERAAVDQRLTAALVHLGDQIAALRQQERAGRQPKMNVDRAVRQFEELSERRERRLRELDRELRLAPLPPRTRAAAFVVPVSLLNALRGDSQAVERTRSTQRIEAIAMREVMRRETVAGRVPRDVSDANRGYDIESIDPATGTIRLIEVKGRDSRGETIVLTRNECLCALNKRADYVLAIVQVEGDAIRDYHAIADPLGRRTDDGLPFGLEASTFAIVDLIGAADRS